MNTDLSPAAQAVLDALDDQFYQLNSQHMAAAIAALRAAADQVVPPSPAMIPSLMMVRHKLFAIATELEAQP